MAILRSLFKTVSWMFHVGVISALVFYVSFGVVTGHFPPKLIHFQKAFATFSELQNKNLLSPNIQKKNPVVNLNGPEDEVQELMRNRQHVTNISENINNLVDESGSPLLHSLKDGQPNSELVATPVATTPAVQPEKQSRLVQLLPAPEPVKRNRASVTPDPAFDESYAAVAARIRAETRRGQSNFQQQQSAQ